MTLPTVAVSLLAFEEGGGFNPLDFSHASNLLWTIVIFLAALPFMWKIVWGPMAKALEERDRHAAEAAKAAAEQAKADVEKRLADAQKESAKVIADARSIGEQQGRQALADAQ